MHDIIVVGGGAAGMTASLFAARNGASVTLLEQNEKLGKKEYISGKGRCNDSCREGCETAGGSDTAGCSADISQNTCYYEAD